MALTSGLCPLPLCSPIESRSVAQRASAGGGATPCCPKFIGTGQLQEACLRQSRKAQSSRKRHLKLSATVACSTLSREDTAVALNGHVNGAQQEFIDGGIFNNGELAWDGHWYREEFVLRFYEVGVNRTASITTIANLLQEVAANHLHCMSNFKYPAAKVIEDMAADRVVWVLSSINIQMDSYPLWKDKVVVETFLSSLKRLGVSREWVIRNAATGERLGAAISTWVPINMDTRKLVRIPQYAMDELQHIISSPGISGDALNEYTMKVVSPTEADADWSSKKMLARKSDLDMNDHLNNVTYIEWMMEAIPHELAESHELRSLKMEFRSECPLECSVDSLAALWAPEANGAAVPQAREGEPSTGAAADTSSHSEKNGGKQLSKVFDPSMSARLMHTVCASGGGTEFARGYTRWEGKTSCAINLPRAGCWVENHARGPLPDGIPVPAGVGMDARRMVNPVSARKTTCAEEAPKSPAVNTAGASTVEQISSLPKGIPPPEKISALLLSALVSAKLISKQPSSAN
eukprot:jgi/Mesvir1/19397/Mv10430-RA.1